MTEWKPRDSQLLHVLKAIVEKGLNLDDFDFKKAPSTELTNLTITRLVHVPSGWFISFDFVTRGTPCSSRNPGRLAPEEIESFSSAEAQTKYVLEWLDLVKEDLEAPKLWEEFIKERNFLETTTLSDNSSFTPEERNLLVEVLRQIRDDIINQHASNEEQAAHINDRFNYLEEAMQRFGRKDWINLAIGVIAILEGIALSPQQAGSVFKHLIEFVRLVTTTVRFLTN